MSELHDLYEDSKIRVSRTLATSDDVFLCFSGIGMAMGGLEIQQEEFAKATNGASAFFVVDKTRSWGNFDWSHLSKLLSPYLVNKKVFSLGNSMGGYCAILASLHFSIHKVIAFVPQFSVHKSVVPLETRWSNYTDAITEWKYISLENSFVDETDYHIFYGDDSEDALHRLLFPEQKNIFMYHCEGNHNLVQNLKEKGLLYDLIAKIVE